MTYSKRVAIIVGEPCVGKSTIMDKFIEMTSPGWTFDKYGRKFIPHYKHTAGMVLLGDYEDPDQQFPGTDRMSMAAQPHAIDFVRDTMRPIVFEGDRLGTISMIDACRHMKREVMVFVVVAKPNILTARRKRERQQTDIFVQSRQTKINNIIAHLPNENLIKLENNKPVDARHCANQVYKYLTGKRKA